jgi:Tfp pilus assembly protein FimV
VCARPSNLLKKLQNILVVEAIGYDHLQNALGISSETARDIIAAYYEQQAIRYFPTPMDACDEKLMKRASNIIGTQKAYDLVGKDVHGLQKMQQENKRETEMREVSTRLQEQQEQLQEMQKQMQEQTKLLAALQPLMRTMTVPTQGSTSAPQPSSAQYVMTGQPGSVHFYNPRDSNRFEITHGQGSRNQELDPPPRRSVPPAQTGAGPAFASGGDRQRVESFTVSPADLVFRR